MRKITKLVLQEIYKSNKLEGCTLFYYYNNSSSDYGFTPYYNAQESIGKMLADAFSICETYDLKEIEVVKFVDGKNQTSFISV